MREQIREILHDYINEGWTDKILKFFNKYPFHEYQKIVNAFLDVQDFKIIRQPGQFGGEDILLYKSNPNVSEIEVINGFNKDHEPSRIMNVRVNFIREMEQYIPRTGLVICIMKWVEKRTGDKTIKDYSIKP
jgi:hypothetical protein